MAATAKPFGSSPDVIGDESLDCASGFLESLPNVTRLGLHWIGRLVDGLRDRFRPRAACSLLKSSYAVNSNPSLQLASAE
ncbi:MAG TPA: hypothetical protein VJT73_02960, partial [Polyangiaceae bacterium]|nr:hypothetical protein [Polyangiaceae bacterium]